MMKYIYTDGCIISAPQNVIRFIKDDSLTEPFQSYNTNERIVEIRYPTGSTYDQIQLASVVTYNSEVTFEGDIDLYPQHTLNGLTITLRKSTGKYLFSCFLDYEATEVTYEENEIGGWIIVPAADLSDTELTTKVVECINNNSTLYYVSSSSFNPANIVGVDLTEDKVQAEYYNTVPFGEYQKLYLTEADIIAGFIRECKKQFPEIEFFPQSSERRNLGKETIYYRSHISQDRSSKFNSNLLDSRETGRYFQTTIPIEMYYQTTDIKQYVNRRNTYLLSHFLMNVHNFDVVKDKGYTDKWGNRTETFNFATYWERNAVQNELMKADANDGSGRDTYTLTMLCDLIGFIIERCEKVVKVRQIIINVYFNNTNISTFKTNYTDGNYTV